MDMASRRSITNSNGNKESADKKAGHGGSQENVKEVFTDDNHDDLQQVPWPDVVQAVLRHEYVTEKLCVN